MSLSPFQRAVDVAQRTLARVAGVWATYTQESTGTAVELRVVPGSMPAEVVDEEGAMVKVRRKDFLIDTCEFEDQGMELPPARGDQIEITINDQPVTYEVIGPGGQPPWQWSDAAHTRLRVHCQEI